MATVRLEVLANFKGKAELQKVKKDLKDMGLQVKKTNTNISKGSESSIKKFGKMALAIGGVTTGIILAQKAIRSFVDGFKTAIDLETGLAEISTLVDINVVSLESLKDTVLETSRTYGQSFDVVTKALYDSVSAGVAAGDAQEFLSNASKLAVAGVTDVAVAVDQLTSIMNAYKIPATEMARVTDTILTAVRFGKTTVGELGANIGKLAPVAKAAGLSIEQMFAAVSTLTLGGLRTDEAITGMRATLAALLNPAEDAKKAMDEFHLSISSERLAKPGEFIKILQEIEKATNGNFEAMSRIIPNIRALPAILTLAGDEASVFSEIMREMNEKLGATDDAFGKVAKTTGQKVKEFGAAWQIFKEGVFSTFLPALTAAMQGLMRFGSATVSTMKKAKDGFLEFFDVTGVVAQKQFAALPIEGKLEQLEGKIRKTKDLLASIGDATGFRGLISKGQKEDATKELKNLEALQIDLQNKKTERDNAVAEIERVNAERSAKLKADIEEKKAANARSVAEKRVHDEAVVIKKAEREIARDKLIADAKIRDKQATEEAKFIDKQNMIRAAAIDDDGEAGLQMYTVTLEKGHELFKKAEAKKTTEAANALRDRAEREREALSESEQWYADQAEDYAKTWAGGVDAAVTSIRDGYKTMGDLGAETFVDLHSAFNDSFTALIKGDLDSIGDIWNNFWDGLKNRFLSSFVNKISDGLIDGLSSALSGAVSGAVSGGGKGGGLLEGLFSGIGSLFGGEEGGLMSGLTSGISGVISSIGSGITSTLGGLVSGIGGLFSGGAGGLLSSLGGGVTGLLGSIGGGFTSLIGLMGGPIGGLVAGGLALLLPHIKEIFSKVVDAVKSFFSGIGNMFKGETEQGKLRDEFSDQFGEVGGAQADVGHGIVVKEGVEAFFDSFNEEWRKVFAGEVRQNVMDTMHSEISQWFGVTEEIAGSMAVNIEKWAHDVGISAQDFANIMGDSTKTFGEKMKELGDAAGVATNEIEEIGKADLPGVINETSDALEKMQSPADNLSQTFAMQQRNLDQLGGAVGNLSHAFGTFSLPEIGVSHAGSIGEIPKFHNGKFGGLKSDEQFAVIQKRESVLQPEQLSTMIKNARGSSVNLSVTISDSNFNGTPEENAEAIEKVLVDRIKRKESDLSLAINEDING